MKEEQQNKNMKAMPEKGKDESLFQSTPCESSGASVGIIHDSIKQKVTYRAFSIHTPKTLCCIRASS